MFLFKKGLETHLNAIVSECVVVVEQTYCHYHKKQGTEHFGDEAKARCLKLIDELISKKERKYLLKHKDADYLSRRVEYYLYLLKQRKGIYK